jgi:soluble cytochrome b562
MEDKLQFKKKVLKAAKEKQKEVIEDLQEAIDRRQEAVERNDSDMRDYFESTREEILEYVEHLYHQLDIARKEFDLLNRLRIEKLHDSVSIGSVVETDIKRFYISVGLEEFEVEGTEFFGLSTRAPIYSAMIGKKKGDTFNFRGEDHEIKDLY